MLPHQPVSADAIRNRFQKNLTRVSHLIQVFRIIHPGGGRPSELEADVLRAAVVFIHSTLEDLLRSAEELRFPQTPSSAFERIRWVSHGSESKPDKKKKPELTLSELAKFRGKTVAEILLACLQEHLKFSTYNTPDDVVGALNRMDLRVKPFSDFLADVKSMMKRRHSIAHRADVNEKHQRLTNTITVNLVQKWRDVVEAFGNQLLLSL